MKYIIYNSPLLVNNMMIFKDGMPTVKTVTTYPCFEASSKEDAKNLLHANLLNNRWPYSGELNSPNEWIVEEYNSDLLEKSLVVNKDIFD